MVRVSLVLLFFVFLMSSCGGDSGDNLRREDNRIEILSEKLELLEQEKNDLVKAVEMGFEQVEAFLEALKKKKEEKNETN